MKGFCAGAQSARKTSGSAPGAGKKPSGADAGVRQKKKSIFSGDLKLSRFTWNYFQKSLKIVQLCRKHFPTVDNLCIRRHHLAITGTLIFNSAVLSYRRMNNFPSLPPWGLKETFETKIYEKFSLFCAFSGGFLKSKRKCEVKSNILWEMRFLR